MSVTYPVRAAVKTLLEANIVQPDEPAGTLRVYVSPEEDDPESADGPISLVSFPAILIQKSVYDQLDFWKRMTQADYEYTWDLQIVVFLAEHVLPSYKAQKLVEDWQTAVANVILAQPTLSGTIVRMEQDDAGRVLTSRDGNWDWYTQDTRQPQSYWGIGFNMTLTQEYTYAETVGISS